MALKSVFELADNISITEAREMLTRLPQRLAGGNQAIALTRRGKPVMALMSWDLYQSIVETLDIMGDPDLMSSLRQSIKEAGEGNVIPCKLSRLTWRRNWGKCDALV